MDYIAQLFKLLRNERVLDSFIRNLFDFTDNENYTLSSIRILPCEEGNSLLIDVSNDELNVIKISIAEYKIRYVEENYQFMKPELNGYTERYLKYMAELFPDYANDCIQDKLLECEKNKHKQIEKLEKLFNISQGKKTDL